MDSFIEQLTGNPVYMGAAVVLAVLIMLAFLKKLVKVALVLFAALVLYIGYLFVTGKDISDIQKQVEGTVKSVTKGLETTVGNAAKNTVDKVFGKQ